MNRADDRNYGNLLGDSSSHTPPLRMSCNSRRIGFCVTDGQWGQMRDTAGHDCCEEKIWVTLESHWSGTWFTAFSKRELVPQSTLFYTMQYVFIFQLFLQSVNRVSSVSHSSHMLYYPGHQLFWKTIWNKMLSHHFIFLGATGNFIWFVIFFSSSLPFFLPLFLPSSLPFLLSFLLLGS